ncbi:MAG: cytochrome c oxidase assembly protein [Solibacillus sp.]|jgi:putative membrane protein|uniref:cytochrome c oxidase assembly protein n=1 Tax=unclassified Solibacillus TaxID=2637870 RepID=UPI0030F84D2C
MSMPNHLHHTDEVNHFIVTVPQILLAFPFVILLTIYIVATIITNRRYRPWPLYRTVLWTLGIVCAIIAVAGPLANRAMEDFTFHMLTHLLLGMLAPLLMALGAPMSLVLRTLRTPLARRLSKALKSWPSRLYTHPIVAAFLNIGGLWLLYTTDLYPLMHENSLVHILVHLHVFIAGYLFTISIIYVDPVAHRISFLYRAIVLMLALAGHGILSKYIYANPPVGVSVKQAEAGGMFMYYGGDAIDALLIIFLCLQWYRATRPRTVLTKGNKQEQTVQSSNTMPIDISK